VNNTPQNTNSPKRKTSNITGIVLSVASLITMLFACYVVKRVIDAPAETIKAIPGAITSTSDAAAAAFKKLAQAINSQTIKTEYASTNTTLTRTSHLQVMALNQIECFDKRHMATSLGIRLPDVVVSARAPVEYVYYIDLAAKWDFRIINGTRIYVIAPPIQFNTPSVDVSAMAVNVVQTSIFRDDKPALLALKESITGECQKRAVDNIQVVKEAARREAERFVQRFIAKTYGVDEDTPVTVLFGDETALPVLTTKRD
jgi:hypothetical protein